MRISVEGEGEQNGIRFGTGNARDVVNGVQANGEKRGVVETAHCDKCCCVSVVRLRE